MTATAPVQWVTVAAAAVLVNRDPSRIYVWIDPDDDGKVKLRHRINLDGVIEVPAAEVARVAAVTRRGRPRGSVSLRTLTKGNI